MRTSIVCIARVVLFLSCLAPLEQLQAVVTLPDPSGPAATLVQAALQAELDGHTELRQKLLDQAIARDPEFAPARWQLGFVRWDGGWLHINDVPRRAADDKSLTAYRNMRDAMVDTADNHRAVAKWCHRNRLADEERLHWAKALEFEPDNSEALTALKLQFLDGRVMTQHQIAQQKSAASEAVRAMRYWRPQILKWRKAIEHGGSEERAQALANLHSLGDPAAIPALETVLGVKGSTSNSAKLNELLIETLARIPQTAATQALVRRAVHSDSAPARTAAIAQLKKRPQYSYVPSLIAALWPPQVRTRFQIHVEADGTVVHQHFVIREGLFHDECRIFESALRPVRVQMPADTERKLAIAKQEAAAIEQEAMIEQGIDETTRLRIETILAQNTELRKTDDPRSLMQQWIDYTEAYPPSMQPRTLRTEFISRMSAFSCFPAGTPIATITGTLPIEKIKIGDRVLAQNPQNGELAYKQVQGVTLRPAVPLVEIGVGTETIRATRGHPFWVNGQGWLMAKQLQVGAFLHTVNGAVPIDRIGEAPAAEAYNLVVSEFNTYFVGDVQELVHDNMPLTESAELVPGLSGKQP